MVLTLEPYARFEGILLGAFEISELTGEPRENRNYQKYKSRLKFLSQRHTKDLKLKRKTQIPNSQYKLNSTVRRAPRTLAHGMKEDYQVLAPCDRRGAQRP